MSFIQVANLQFDPSGTARIEKLANGQMRIVGNTVSILASNIAIGNAAGNIVLSAGNVSLSGSTILSGNVNLPFPTYNFTEFDKGALTPNTSYTQAHTYGANIDFRRAQMFLRFAVANSGYQINDIIMINDMRAEFTKWINTTHMGISSGVAGVIRNKFANNTMNPYTANLCNVIMRVYN